MFVLLRFTNLLFVCVWICFCLPPTAAAAAAEARRNGTKSCSGSLVSTSVDLAVLKALFPQSITFDCCCTKGKAVNITAGLSVGGEQGMMGRQRSPRWDYQVRKMRNERRNIKVTEQSVFCDIDFHMINPGDSFPCYCHQGLMRKVICSQATLNISSSACIIWQGNLSQNTAKARDGGEETPASVPGWRVSPSLCQHGGAITHSKPLCFN